MSGRSPRGTAGGALFGQYPSPGLGFGGAAGSYLFDDFVSNTQSDGGGELGWALDAIGGAGATKVAIAVASANEFGVTELTTTATIGRGGTVNLTNITRSLPTASGLSPGMFWFAKIRSTSTTSVDVWSGFAGSLTASVRTADATRFLGVRFDAAASAQWQGVVKDGAAAGNETTVDLGAVAAATWFRAGFRVVDTGGGTPGVQFFTWESDVNGIGYTDVGSAITRTIAANIGPIAIGAVARSASTRLAAVDLWGTAGRWAR